MSKTSFQNPQLVLDLMESKSYSCAWDIYYFRSSPNWTLELEQELIKRHSEGKPPSDLSKFGRFEL